MDIYEFDTLNFIWIQISNQDSAVSILERERERERDAWKSFQISQSILKSLFWRDAAIRLSSEKEYAYGPAEVSRLNYDLEPHLIIDSKSLNSIKLNRPDCIEFLVSEITEGENLLCASGEGVLNRLIFDFLNFFILFREVPNYWYVDRRCNWWLQSRMNNFYQQMTELLL